MTDDELFDVDKLRRNWDKANARPAVEVHPRIADVAPGLDPRARSMAAFESVRTEVLARFDAHAAALRPYLDEIGRLLDEVSFLIPGGGIDQPPAKARDREIPPGDESKVADQANSERPDAAQLGDGPENEGDKGEEDHDQGEQDEPGDDEEQPSDDGAPPARERLIRACDELEDLLEALSIRPMPF